MKLGTIRLDGRETVIGRVEEYRWNRGSLLPSERGPALRSAAG